jgi:hypothetical protein
MSLLIEVEYIKKNKWYKSKKKVYYSEKRLVPFENEGVLNPAAIKEGDFVHLFLSSSAK